MDALGIRRDPRHHPDRGGQRAAANGCLNPSPEIQTVAEMQGLYQRKNNRISVIGYSWRAVPAIHWLTWLFRRALRCKFCGQAHYDK